MKLVFLKDFCEDRRISMEHYSAKILEKISKIKGFESSSAFVPSIPAWLSRLPVSEIIKLRLARFFVYPNQIRKIKADIFHIVDHGYAHLTMGLDPKKTVVTVHDLIPLLAHKKLIKGLNFFWPPLLVMYSLSFLKRAARIIAVSENTKNDLIRHLLCDPAKISVVHNGLDESFRNYSAVEKDNCRRFFRLPEGDNHYVLVSGVQVYKNHETSLKVIKRLQNICDKPVFVIRLGADSPNWTAMVKENDLEDRVITPGSLPPEHVADLYNSVDCLLFPSWYEGFGWPPLEAMACGTPVVSSNVASLPEVIGTAGLMHAPNDIDELTKSVYEVLTDTNLRTSLIAKGIERARLFSWAKTAEKMTAIYQNINVGEGQADR